MVSRRCGTLIGAEVLSETKDLSAHTVLRLSLFHGTLRVRERPTTVAGGG
jgi:hypothetical protein